MSKCANKRQEKDVLLTPTVKTVWHLRVHVLVAVAAPTPEVATAIGCNSSGKMEGG